MPSNEAARLCVQAPADGILVSALVVALAGRCEGIEFSAVGELKLKGFQKPVATLAVSWAPLAQETGVRADRPYYRMRDSWMGHGADRSRSTRSTMKTQIP